MATGEQKVLNERTQKLFDMFVARLNAGLPLTRGEWNKLGDASREVWETCYTEWRLKNIATEAHFIADSISGGRLAIEVIWDILPENIQEHYLKMWSKEDAEQNKTINDGS